MLKMKQAIDEDIRRLGRINLVETKEASCNTTPVECTRSFKMGTDPVSFAALSGKGQI